MGLRYVAGQGGPPVIVCRAKGAQADVMVEAAAELGIPRAPDHGLAAALAKRVPMGSPLPNRFFDRAARAIYAAGQA